MLKNCFANVEGVSNLNQSCVKENLNLAAVGCISFWGKNQINVFRLRKSPVIAEMCALFKPALQKQSRRGENMDFKQIVLLDLC